MSECCRPDGSTQNPADSAGKPVHIAIIGSGSAAFAAAIKATELGARVSMIEAADMIGGTCVNSGCVPSKIMIQGAQLAWQQHHHGFDGIPHRTAQIDRQAMLAQQQNRVASLRHAKYESILQNHPAIELIRGKAGFCSAHELCIRHNDGSESRLQADRYLLATGARARIPDIPGLAATPYWTAEEALLTEEIPGHLLVLGGSVVALELAQAFLHLGARVTLLARSTLLSKEDEALGAGLLQILRDEGMQIHLYSLAETISHDNNGFHLQMNTGGISGDRLLVATGRQPNTDSLALDAAGIKTDRHGRILINECMRTTVPHIYAAGDCSNLPQYVYVAAAAGSRAARNMLGDNVLLDLGAMPRVVFTHPQVACVGLNRLQAASKGLQVHSRLLALENVPRATANMDQRGFIQLVAEVGSGHLLGCQILAENAGEMIQTAALAIHQQMTVEQLAEQLFPYLTMVEGLKLTAQTFSRDISQLSCCAG